MAADSVLGAVEALIDANRGTGEPLAIFQSVNNSSVQPGEEGQYPYLIMSAGSQRLVLDSGESKLHVVPITIAIYGNSRAGMRTATQTLKNTIEPSFENAAIVSSLVTSDIVQIYAAEEIDTVESKLGDRAWVARWNLEFGTRTVKG